MKPVNRRYDLVIIGAGLSGASAAAEAGDLGLSTLVIEKGRKTGGTGAYVEGVFAVGSDLQKSQGIDLTEDDILAEEYDWTHGLADMNVWRKYVYQAKQNIDWLQDHGAVIKQMRILGTGKNTWHLFDGHGQHAINAGLLPSAQKHGVEIITSAQAQALFKDQTGRIASVSVKDWDSGDVVNIQTNNVIIATGGYLNNLDLLKSNVNGNADRIIPVNSGKNTGDGLQLAWSVGAKKYRMGTVMMFGGQVFDRVPGYQNWLRQINRAVTHEALLWVNERGRRFASEDCTDIWAIAGNSLIGQNKVYAILDQAQFNQLPQHSFKANFNYDQLLSQLEDDLVHDKPYLTRADSVVELAEKLHLPDLVKTVARYNDLAAQQVDLDLHKAGQYLHAINEGPFYAVELGVGAFCTMGGLRVDEDNAVLDENGLPIAGLYAVGSDGSAPLIGDTYGVNIPGSEAGYCVYSGRNAVQQIVRKER